MNTIRIEISDGPKLHKAYTYTLPANVDELKASQLAMIAGVLEKHTDPEIQRMEILIRLARIKRMDLMDGEMVMSALKMLEFLDDKKFVMERPIIRRIGLFKAPKRRMIGFTGGQMALCDTILQAIESMEQIPNKLLADFCAANCSLIGFRWSNFIADHIAIPFFRYLVPRRWKMAMLIQYRAMRRIFPKKYELAFDDPDTAERFPSLGWSGTIVRLAGDKFGNPKQVRKTPAHDLFLFLEQCKRDEIRAQSLRKK